MSEHDDTADTPEPDTRASRAARRSLADEPDTLADKPALGATEPAAAGGWGKRRVFGLIVLMAGVVVGLSLLTRDGSGPFWLQGLGAGLLALGGAWLLGAGHGPLLVVPTGVLVLGIGALGLSAQWWWLVWPAGGAGCGAVASWAYARQHRAAWATSVILLAAYGVTVVAALLMALRQEGYWWILGEGLGSLALGAVLVKLCRERRETLHGRIGYGGGLLLAVAGLGLPYAGLLLMGVAESQAERPSDEIREEIRSEERERLMRELDAQRTEQNPRGDSTTP